MTEVIRFQFWGCLGFLLLVIGLLLVDEVFVWGVFLFFLVFFYKRAVPCPG